MEKLYPSNKVRFRHLYDKTDKEEQILFYRCSLMVETYIKIHVRNQEDVYNLRQEVLLKVVEGLDKSYHERGRFFQWAMTITINMGICNRLLLNILQVISQKYGLNL